ncbi:MAG: RNA-binding protein [Cyanobacteria bacterium KgW148]|nr:RNA-binding protein [Cyanobacteria bacterium KgW148]
MTIYVGNLSYRATQEDLEVVFSDYGTVKRVQLPMDRESGRVRGFAFVDMEEEAQEDAAIQALDGAKWMGRDLRVNKARPREASSNNNRRSAPTRENRDRDRDRNSDQE